MKRVYVIMCDLFKDGDFIETNPVDVVSTMERAEDVCLEFEQEYPSNVYYWREVISSED